MQLKIHHWKTKMHKLLFLTLTVHSHWVSILSLHREGCFSINATFSCNEPSNEDHETCEGTYTYSYRFSNTSNNPLKLPPSIQIQLSCPTSEYVEVANDMEYILQYKHKDYCIDGNRDCLESPCVCCTKPSDNLCTLEAQVLESDRRTCNENHVSFCEIKVDAILFEDEEWMSCVVAGSGFSGRDYGCILQTQAGPLYWCYARWARIYYNCLSRVTQHMTKATTTTTISSTTLGLNRSTETSRGQTNLDTFTKTATKEEDVESTEKSSNIGLIVGLATACVVLLVCVVTLIAGILLYRKKQNPSTKNKPHQSNPQTTEYYNIAQSTNQAQQSTDCAEINPNIPPNFQQPTDTIQAPVSNIQAGGHVSEQSHDMYEYAETRNMGAKNMSVVEAGRRQLYENTTVLPPEGQNTATASSSDYYNISMPNTNTEQQSQENAYETTANMRPEVTAQNVYQPLQGAERQRRFDYENLAIESDYITN